MRVTRANSQTPAIYRVADRMAPSVRRRFLRAVDALAGKVDLTALATAVDARQIDQITQLLRLPDLPTQLQSMAAQVIECFQRSGIVAATELAQQLSINAVFDIVNPAAVNWARQSSSRLIVDISDETRRAIRTLVANGIQNGVPAAQTARLLRDSIGLTERQALAVANYQAELLANGRTADDITRLGSRYAQQLTNARAKLIARTETITSSNQGQQQAWQQNADKGLFDPERTKRRWSTTSDERACPICVPMNGQEVAFAGEAFKGGDGSAIAMPPAHPACRCSVGLVIAK